MKTVSLLSSLFISLSFISAGAYAGNDIDLQGFDLGGSGGHSASAAIIHNQAIADKNAQVLFRSAQDFVAGNPEGKVTLVEFMDFKCKHTKNMEPVIESLVESNPDLRVVFKEFPIRGEVSTYAAMADLAAKKQKNAYAFHKAMMNADGLDDAKVLELAKASGLDVQRLEADMKNSAISQTIAHNKSLAAKLSIQGTPAFFVRRSNLTGPIDFYMGEASQNKLQDSINKMS